MPIDHFLDIGWTDEWTVYLAVASLLGTIFIALMANHWAMKYWRKQKKEEINFQLHNLRYQGRLEAAKSIWGLLAFLSEKENGKNLLNYKGTKEKPEVFFDLDRGKLYIENLSDVFYKSGHGIFLTKEINQEIFHVRTNVYKVIDKEQRAGKRSGEVLIENSGLIDFFRNSYESLRSKIKKYVLEELEYVIET
jgi:hypothetical protein